MRPLGELEDGLEADALFPGVSLAERLGASAYAAQRLKVFSSESRLIAFDLDIIWTDSDGYGWNFAFIIRVVVCILDDFHQEPCAIRV